MISAPSKPQESSGGIPDAVPDNYTVEEDTVLTVPGSGLFGVLNNDNANGSASMSAAVVDEPAGMLNLNPDGSFDYTPPAQFVGTDTFTYAVTGSGGTSAAAQVSIAVEEDGRIEVTNTCDSGGGSLRDALALANFAVGVDTILFDITDDVCGTQTINLASALPDIIDPVIIDGLLQDAVGASDRSAPFITLNGQGGAFSGFNLPQAASGSVIRGLIITNFGGSGLLIGLDGPGNNNIFAANVISGNGGGSVFSGLIAENDGASVCDGVGNQFSGSSFSGNFDQDIDLGCDGFTPNDPGDPDQGPNDLQNFPVLLTAAPNGDISGLMNSLPATDFVLQFYSSPDCSDSAQTLLTAAPDTVTTDGIGNVLFTVNVGALAEGVGVYSTATQVGTPNTSEYSNCVRTSDETRPGPARN